MGLQARKNITMHIVHEKKNLRVFVHGDDFVSLGSETEIKWLHEKMASIYEVKVRGVVGPEDGDLKHMRILNRFITWHPWGVGYEADPRHAEKVIEEMGLGRGKGVSTPIIKEKEEEGCEEELGPEEAKVFRGLAARINFLAIDRPDIQYAAKEICRYMARPRHLDYGRIKRVARYLISKPRMEITFPYQRSPQTLTVLSDSDYAGCLKSRRSTSGGAILYGRCLVKSWSSTQAVISLSSSEAEYYALVKSSSEGLGIKSAAADWEVKVGVEVNVDSNGAKGIAGRQGLNKRTRHIGVHLLWVQEKVQGGEVVLRKIDGKKNGADLGTKALDQQTIQTHCDRLGVAFLEGRHHLAPSSAK